MSRLSLGITQHRNGQSYMFSFCGGTQFVDFEFWSPLKQRRAFGEMLCEFGIVIQPPKSIGGENKVRGASATQLFKIGNCMWAVARIAIVGHAFLEEMPTLALRIIKYRRVAAVRCDNQRTRGGGFPQFHTGIAKCRGRRSIKRPNIQVSENCERARKQDRHCHHPNARRDFRFKKSASGARESSSDRHERKLIPWMAVAIADYDDEQNHRRQPPMKEPCIFPAWRDEQTDDRHYRENWGEAQCRGQSHDVPVPSKILDPDPALAKEVIRIKSLGNLMRVPVPRERRQDRNCGEKPKVGPFQKSAAPFLPHEEQKRRSDDGSRQFYKKRQ